VRALGKTPEEARQIIARTNNTNPLTALRLISVPAEGSAP